MDELGAHVSSAGGCQRVHARAAELEASVLQMFTKQPQRWADPDISAQEARAFREQRDLHSIRVVISHASYLPNLATPDPELLDRSFRAQVAELQRCVAFGVDYLVDHPGNATDGERERGLVQNAHAIGRLLDAVDDGVLFLIELTAGGRNALGSSFEEAARMLELIPRTARDRVGVCVDTAHLHAAGYDLLHDYDAVILRLDAVIGIDRLHVIHLNDTPVALGGRRDRHAWIGDGQLGLEPFRRILNDDRLRHIPKIIETPKGKDHLAADRENLGRLRRLRS